VQIYNLKKQAGVRSIKRRHKIIHDQKIKEIELDSSFIKKPAWD
jgi:hypothetical protein